MKCENSLFLPISLSPLPSKTPRNRRSLWQPLLAPDRTRRRPYSPYLSPLYCSNWQFPSTDTWYGNRSPSTAPSLQRPEGNNFFLRLQSSRHFLLLLHHPKLLSSFYPWLQKSWEALIRPLLIIIETVSPATINVSKSGHQFQADSNAVPSLFSIDP